ncbi:unnamed protein product [Merluccius merluccius]
MRRRTGSEAEREANHERAMSEATERGGELERAMSEARRGDRARLSEANHERAMRRRRASEDHARLAMSERPVSRLPSVALLGYLAWLR